MTEDSNNRVHATPMISLLSTTQGSVHSKYRDTKRAKREFQFGIFKTKFTNVRVFDIFTPARVSPLQK